MPSNTSKLGEVGEAFNLKFLNKERGMKVFKSTSSVDSVKDFYWYDGDVMKLGEVKTEVPYMKKKAFTFRKSQEHKCFTKDMLSLVTVPYRWKGRWYEHGGCLFICEQPNKLYWEEYTQDFWGKPTRMIAIPFQQEGLLNLVHRIDPDIEPDLWNNLRKFNSSQLKEY